MPTYFARKAGNINATDVWATTPSGTASDLFPSFTSGDVLMANSFAITVNVSCNLGSTGQVRNDTTGGATAGGSFTLANGVTLTANVFGPTIGGVCVTFAGANPNSSTISGNITGGSSSTSHGASNTGSGALNIVGNCTAGTGNTAHGITNTAGGTVNITGNCFGNSGPLCHGANNNAGGTINITGNCTGGSIGGSNASFGANNAGVGSLNITGNCTGGSASAAHGANNNSTGTLTIVGPVSQGGNTIQTGGTSTGAFGANNTSTGVMNITGPVYASEFDGGVGSTNRSSLNFLTGPFYTSTTWGVNPNRCVSWRWATNLVNTTFIEVPTANLATKRNLVTPDNATNFPAPANVRSGTTYGIGGALVGTCAVPLPAQVAPGVPIDNTIGTLPTPSAADVANAVWSAATRTITGGTVDTLTNAPASVTPADIWSHSTRTITGGTVTTLTNAPTVPSASAIASQVRTELGTELGRIDAAISTRATPANIPTSDITAIKAKTDALNTTRLGQVATTEIVGNLLAQANS